MPLRAMPSDKPPPASVQALLADFARRCLRWSLPSFWPLPWRAALGWRLGRWARHASRPSA